MVSKAVGAPLSVLAEGSDSDQSFQFSMLAESAAMELEADAIGAALAQAAGYSAKKGMREALGSSPGGASHPSGSDRIAFAEIALSSPMSAQHRIQQCQMREHDSY
jgi:predicted Zn-dependent protease